MDAPASIKVGELVVKPIEAENEPFPLAWKPWHQPPELLVLGAPRGWFDARFGPPTEDDPGGRGHGHETYWNFVFPCGLRCSVVVVREGGRVEEGIEGALVVPEVAETDHLLRHLGVPRDWVEWDALRELHPPDEIVLKAREAQETWAVWRQDDNGNQLVAGYCASERDAKCLAEAFERRAHKQMYWTEKRAGNEGTAPAKRRE